MTFKITFGEHQEMNILFRREKFNSSVNLFVKRTLQRMKKGD